MTSLVVNLKRMVRLLSALPDPAGDTVRAELAGMGDFVVRSREVLRSLDKGETGKSARRRSLSAGVFEKALRKDVRAEVMLDY